MSLTNKPGSVRAVGTVKARDFPELPPSASPEMKAWWKEVRDLMDRQRAELHKVAFSGDYNDLENTP